MLITRSLQASALFLSFTSLAEGWSLHRKHDEHFGQRDNARYPVYQPRRASHEGVADKRHNQLVCPSDQWQAFLDSVPKDGVTIFCNDYLGIPPATTVVEYTPTVSVPGISRMPSFCLHHAVLSPPAPTLPLRLPLQRVW